MWILSVAWPYTKLVAFGACFLAPEAWLAPRMRGRVLRFLDGIGKWSLLDSFSQVTMMMLFETHVPVGEAPGRSQRARQLGAAR